MPINVWGASNPWGSLTHTLTARLPQIAQAKGTLLTAGTAGRVSFTLAHFLLRDMAGGGGRESNNNTSSRLQQKAGVFSVAPRESGALSE